MNPMDVLAIVIPLIGFVFCVGALFGAWLQKREQKLEREREVDLSAL